MRFLYSYRICYHVVVLPFFLSWVFTFLHLRFFLIFMLQFADFIALFVLNVFQASSEYLNKQLLLFVYDNEI